MMLTLLKALSDLFSPSFDSLQDRDEKYLAEAVDMLDLERRMRQIDTRRGSLFQPGPHGIFAN